MCVCFNLLFFYFILWFIFCIFVGFYRLLKGKCENEQRELQTATIDTVKQIKQGSYVITVQNDELKILIEKIYQTNRQLMKHSDIKTRTILEKEWNDIQKSINEIDSNIKQKSEILFKVRFFLSFSYLIQTEKRHCIQYSI